MAIVAAQMKGSFPFRVRKQPNLMAHHCHHAVFTVNTCGTQNPLIQFVFYRTWRLQLIMGCGVPNTLRFILSKNVNRSLEWHLDLTVPAQAQSCGQQVRVQKTSRCSRIIM